MTTMEMGFSSPIQSTPEERDAHEAEAQRRANYEACERIHAEVRRAKECPYPRRMLRTSSVFHTPRMGTGLALFVHFPRVNDTPYLNDLLIRAWKRDLHEKCEIEAAKMRERREAKERGL